MAACLVLLLDAAHTQDQTREAELIALILETVKAFQALAPVSQIASHGVSILTVLLESQDPALDGRQLLGSTLSREAALAARRLLASWWKRKNPPSEHAGSGINATASTGEQHGIGLFLTDDVDPFEFLNFSYNDLASIFNNSPQ